MRRRNRRTTLLSGALMLATAACGGGDNPAPAANGDGRTIIIKDFEFTPRDLQVKVGDTVTVENADSASHTVTADGKAFDTGPFDKGIRTFTVSQPGTFSYFCTVHPYMTKGVIQVSA